ncbi:hypothetical protein D3C80_1641090 [compost metagenome]
MEGLPHAHDLVGRQRSGAHAPLMPAPMNLGLQAYTGFATDVQRANAFGSVQLVRCKRHQMHVQCTQIDCNLARALHGIDVEKHITRLAGLTDGGDVVHRPQFVVGVHDGDQDGLVGDRISHCLRLNQALCIRVEVRDLEAFPFQMAA